MNVEEFQSRLEAFHFRSIELRDDWQMHTCTESSWRGGPRTCAYLCKRIQVSCQAQELESGAMEEMLMEECAHLKIEDGDDEAVFRSSSSPPRHTFVDLHVVYSIVYQIPVLYVQWVDASTGKPCGVEEALEFFKAVLDPTVVISQEMHPHLGVPYFYLHPCQVPARMKELRNVPDEHYIASWLSIVGIQHLCRPDPRYLHRL